MKHTILRLALAASCILFSATAQTPDISQSATLTGTGIATPIFVGAGAGNGVVGWRLTYQVDGTSFTAAQVAIAGANAADTATCQALASGSFTNIATGNGSLIEDANPTVSGATGNAGVKTWYPCIVAKVTAVTGSGGSIKILMQGWKDRFVFPSTVTPVGTQNVNLIQVGSNAVVTGGVNGSQGVGGLAADGAQTAGNPVMIAGEDTAVPKLAHTIQTDTFGSIVLAGVSAVQSDGSSNTPTIPGNGTSGAPVPTTQRTYNYRFNGSTWDREFTCNSSAPFTLSGSGNTQIVAASGSTIIRICHVSLATGTPENVKLTYGTGVNCATGTADLSGFYQNVTALAFDFTPAGAVRTPAAQALCINQSAAQTTGGIVVYAQY